MAYRPPRQAVYRAGAWRNPSTNRTLANQRDAWQAWQRTRPPGHGVDRPHEHSVVTLPAPKPRLRLAPVGAPGTKPVIRQPPKPPPPSVPPPRRAAMPTASTYRPPTRSTTLPPGVHHIDKHGRPVDKNGVPVLVPGYVHSTARQVLAENLQAGIPGIPAARKVAPIVLPVQQVAQSAHELVSGHPTAGNVLTLASLFPFLRGGAALREAVGVARAGEGVGTAARAGKAAYQTSRPIVTASKKVARHTPRVIKHNELVQQLPKARSRIANVGERTADVISQRLQTAGRRAAAPARRERTIERWLRSAREEYEAHQVTSARLRPLAERGRRWGIDMDAQAALGKPFPEAQVRSRLEAWYDKHGPDFPLPKRLREATLSPPDIPVVRLATAGERVAKAAGRQQRLGPARAAAAVSEHLRVIKKVKAGSPEDQANFWYAQLPASHRNAKGLRLVRGKQAEELERLTSGKALEQLNERQAAVRAAMAKETEPADKLRHLRDLEEIKLAKTDIPHRIRDVSASLHTLDRLIAKPPLVNEAAVRAAHALGAHRQQILVEAGRLTPERAAERRGIVAKFAGLEPTGEEAYLGHRLAQPKRGPLGFKVSGGTGRVKSPPGVGTQNRLILAKTGRLRQSLRVAAEDWRHAQTFAQANKARDDLARMGTPFTGHVPEGHALVNPRGKTIPKHWRSDEFAQFHEDYTDIPALRKQAEEIVQGFVARDPAAHEQMVQDALASGAKLEHLRVVPQRLVDRYYAQFRRSTPRGKAGRTYDAAVDATAASIIFARIGYIPKNFAQNVIMAVPHQGAYLPQNAAKAAQAMADPQLRAFIRAEIGHTGATGAIERESGTRRFGQVARIVSSIADDPVRATAYMHELQAAGVVSRAHPLLTTEDKHRLLAFFHSDTPLKNDVRQRAVDAMADFSRMTPDQARLARRFLIIPGWLVAGTRYPLHFAATHPIRSALLAYIASGEPGAPQQLRLNKPVNEYFAKGMPGYLEGIPLGDRYLRTGSLNPVTTPLNIGQAVAGSIRGKKSPFGRGETAADLASPFGGAIARFAQGEGAGSFRRLAPNVAFAQGLVSPKATKTYPEDATRLGRLKREVGVVPIKVNTEYVRAVNAGTQSASVYADKQRLKEQLTKAGHDWPDTLERAYQLRAKRAAGLDKITARGDRYQQQAFRADIRLLVAEKLMPQAEAARALTWARTASTGDVQKWRRYLGTEYFGSGQAGLIAESKRWLRENAAATP